MKLLMDLSGCDMPYSSITVYSLRVLRGVRDNGVRDVTILCNNVILDKVKALDTDYEIIPIYLTRKISPISALKGYYRWRKIVKGIDYDVIYLPHPFPPYHCIFLKGKIVTTMLDIEGLRTYNGVKLAVMRFVYPFVLKRSNRITTISEFVKQDILKEYPSISDKKIQSVHCSVVVGKPKEDFCPIKDRYLLYVSSFLRHKNAITLVKAFNKVKDRIPHKLVLIGRKNDIWTNEILPYIHNNDLESRIIHIANGVTDNELAWYYKHADLLVHPSYMEGFGYPPIEAAILETPVLTNKETSLEEVTMGLLNYYGPAKDETKLAERIIEILKNPPSKARLKEISDIYNMEYDYQKIAKELYTELLKA